MQKPTVFKFSVTILTLILLFACRKQFDTAAWDVDVLVPLAEGRLQLQDLSNEGTLTEDAKKLFHLVFEEEVLNIGIDTFVGIPDTTIREEYAVPIGGVFIFGGIPFQNEITETTYDLKDIQLLEAIIMNSAIEVNLRNTLDARMLVRYSILSAERDGLVFRVEEFVDPNSTLNRQYTLNGYTLDLTGINKNKTNTLTTEIEIMLDPADSAYQLQAGDLFVLENTFSDIIPSFARGYFGNQVFDFNDVSEIEGFEQIPNGRIDFTEFDVSLEIDNRIGADLSLDVNGIRSFNISDATSANLVHPVLQEDVFVGRGTLLTEDEVRATREVISLTQENSNLDELIEIRPDSIEFDLGIQINPLGNVSLGNDFVVNGQNLSAFLRVDVPLIVGLDGLELVDTLDFTFEREAENDPLEQLNYGFVNIHVRNAYPMQAGLQLYMQDTSGVVFDSLFTSRQWIASGGVNASGRVTDTIQSKIELPIDQERFDQFEKTASLRAVANLNTTELDSVGIYSDGFIDVKIVGDFNANSR